MSRLFVKELPNWVTKDLLILKFKNFGSITDVKIIQKNFQRENLFGFIGFEDEYSAKKIVQKSKFYFLGEKKILVEMALPRKEDHRFQSIKKRTFSGDDQRVFDRMENKLERICETGSIFIRNLSSKTTKDELARLFNSFGFINDIIILKHNLDNTHLIHGIVEYNIPECAVKAAASLDGKIFRGRILHILSYDKQFYSRMAKNNNGFFFSKFNKIRENTEKKDNDTIRQWHTFFISREKILKTLFLRYGITNNILTSYDKIEMNLSKFSLMEARIQNEIALVLKYVGINIDAFNPTLVHKKSRRILLLKNQNQITSFNSKKGLKKFGKIKRIVIIPITNLTVVEYQKKKDALKAFEYFDQKLRDKNQIFIEWAPLNSMNDFQSIKTNKSLKIKNGSFQTESYFLKDIHNYLSPKVKDNKNEYDIHSFQKGLSKFNHVPDLNNEKYKIHNTIGENEKSGTILIRNIPFQLTIYELRKVYENYGTILSIRLPKKFSDQHKGFGFVEFKHVEDAKKAVLSTQNIHIYSRHLVVNLLVKN